MNSNADGKFWGWPGGKNLVYAYFVVGIPSFAWFAFVYAGADYLTGLHQYRVPLYHSAELSIPLIPAMTVFYNSLHLIYAVAPFILRARPEFPSSPAFRFRILLRWECGAGCSNSPTTPISDSIAVHHCMSPGELRRSMFMLDPLRARQEYCCGAGLLV
jgi:hypothetical protein